MQGSCHFCFVWASDEFDVLDTQLTVSTGARDRDDASESAQGGTLCLKIGR